MVASRPKQSVSISIRFNSEKDADILQEILKYKNVSNRMKELIREGMRPAQQSRGSAPVTYNKPKVTSQPSIVTQTETKKEMSAEDLKKNLLGGFM